MMHLYHVSMLLVKSSLSTGHVALRNTKVHRAGYRYHACVRLSGPKRLDPVKKRLHEMFGIQVNFSESHKNYYSAYKYVCKNDPDVYKSANHPDLQELRSPPTKKCMSAYRQKCDKQKLVKNREITVSQLNGLNTINGSQMQNASQSKIR